jgi:hypothetical protein
MHDSDAERAHVATAPPLASALAFLDTTIRQAYDTHDADAQRSQSRYRFGIFVTAWAGALAVLCAVGQLTFVVLDMEHAAHVAEVLELVCIGFAFVGAVIGIRLATLEHWLLDRFQAEQLRLLKFRMLLDPGLWGDDAARTSWQNEVLERRDAVLAVTRDSLMHESERDLMPRLPIPEEFSSVSPDMLRVLLRYYREKRIDTQRAYFTAATDRGTSFLDEPRLLPWFFFASVSLVACHVAVAQAMERMPVWFHGYETWWSNLSVGLVAGSVALPVIWAGIRTWRSARESSRNIARSMARRHMLTEITPLLDQLETTNAAHALCQLQLLELVLESDQREWLRLMREVEWYG